jgi:hypothetical protein
MSHNSEISGYIKGGILFNGAFPEFLILQR